MELKIHTAGSAPDASRPVLDGIRADLGVVPNFAGAIAESPVLVSAFDAELFSRWWLARFAYGPMEWAWRALTYGRRPPMRLRKTAAAAD